MIPSTVFGLLLGVSYGLVLAFLPKKLGYLFTLLWVVVHTALFLSRTLAWVELEPYMVFLAAGMLLPFIPWRWIVGRLRR